MKLYSILIVFLFHFSLCSQSRQDYYWPFGRGDNTSFIDFRSKPIKSEVRISPVGFDRTNASICDNEGKLLFYTNGCQVADSTHEVMSGGDSLNINFFFTEVLNGCQYGYREKQGIVILPDPAAIEGYYIIHKPRDLDSITFDFSQQYILSSYVDLSHNEGKGAVTSKNDTILDRQYIQSGHMTAIQHANGKDWWILQPGDSHSGDIYFRILLSSDTIRVDSQYVELPYIEDVWPSKATAGGYSRFSPDGTKYAYFNLWDGLHLYDFDRETGLLSNGVDLDFGWERNNNVWLSSVEFSPNSRFIYLINTFSLYQLDTWADDLMGSLTHIADRNPVVLSDWDHFHMMAAGPDCKIYIRSGSSTDYLNVIHSPNKKGEDCDFRQADMMLAARTGRGNFPYFPRFRVDETEKCDSTITMVNGIDVFWRKDLKVFPNPVSDYLTLELPEHASGYLRLVNVSGEIVLEREIFRLGTQEYRVDLSTLSAGVYLVDYLPKDNVDRQIYTARVVKE